MSRTVWHVSEYPRFVGGIEINLHTQAQGLKSKGFQQVLLFQGQEESDSRFLSPFNKAFAVRTLKDIELAAKENPPDAILVQKPFSSWMIPQLLKIAPLIRFIHDHDLYCPRRHKYFPLSQRICHEVAGKACIGHGCLLGRSSKGLFSILNLSERLRDLRVHRSAVKLIANSHYVRNELIQNGLSASKIEVLHPLPGDLGTETKPYPKGEPTVLFTGQLLRGKGPDLLLKAVSRMKSKSIRVIFAGDGHMRPELENLTTRYKLHDHVRLLGRVGAAEISALLAQAHIAAVPSRWAEPFGMVGLEAMAAARPVVAFSVGGISEWLWHGINGLGAPEADVETFAQHLDWLLRHPETGKELGENGRSLLERDYRYKDYIEKLESIILQIC